MKNAYQTALRRPAWLRLCVVLFTLLSFSLVSQAQSLSISPNTQQNFGQVAVGQSSTPIQFTISGSNLGSNNVTVSTGEPQYEISLSPTSGFNGNSVILSPTAGSLSTSVYVRLTPSSGGTVPRTVTGSLSAFAFTGTGPVFAGPVSLTGEAIAGTPAITVNPDARGFGNQVINTTSASQSVVVTSSNLTAPISVTAPTGFLVSSDDVSFGNATTLPATGGTLYIRFRPTQVQAYASQVTLTSGSAQAIVNVSGNGIAVPGSLSVTYSPNPLNFGSAQVGTATGSQSFTVNGSGLNGNVTITATNNFQVRVGSNPFGSTATITPVNGSVNGVSVDVRFTPATTGTITENVTVSASNTSTQTVAVTGEGTPAPVGANISVNPTSITFGNVTQSGSFDTRTITVSGTNLGTNPITLTPSSSNIQLRNVSAGGAFVSGPLVIASSGGTVAPVTVEVRLVAPISGGSFTETIQATSPGATPVTIGVTATSNGNVSDISITNPANNTFTFATRPATFSVAQSFLISGTNLLQDISVAPAGTNGGYFQVSTDNVNFFSSVTLARDPQNNVPQQAVYVRFVPGSNALTVNALIRATSAPAQDRDVSVTGISEPTIRLLQAIGSFGDATVKNTKSPAKTIRLETFLLTGPLNLYFPSDVEDPQRNPSGTPQYEFMIVGGGTSGLTNTYLKSDTLLNNPDGNRIVNLMVRYAPTRVGASTQDLTFTNAALNNGNPLMLLSGNGRATGFAIAEEPSAQSTAQIVRPSGSTTATITFDLANPPAGTSYGQNRLVIASRTYTQLPTSLFPLDKQNFNPGTTVGGAYQYGTGTTIEASSGTYVVFSGAANSFTVGNLQAGENYYFYAFEFNDDGLLNAENYKVPNNQPQNPLPVELVSFTAKLRNGRVLLEWATAQEKNNKGFEIQRSSDKGATFTALGFRNGNGTTSNRSEYEFEDARPVSGLSYYRLKQVDTDGTPHFSKMIAVDNSAKDVVSVYPNPVGNQLNVRLTGANTEASVVVMDMMGRKVLSGKLAADGTFDTSSLKTGNYIVTVTSGAETTTHKVVKQ
jgi:hypothetical protein